MSAARSEIAGRAGDIKGILLSGYPPRCAFDRVVPALQECAQIGAGFRRRARRQQKAATIMPMTAPITVSSMRRSREGGLRCSRFYGLAVSNRD
jgi:hypothetical protein